MINLLKVTNPKRFDCSYRSVCGLDLDFFLRDRDRLSWWRPGHLQKVWLAQLQLKLENMRKRFAIELSTVALRCFKYYCSRLIKVTTMWPYVARFSEGTPETPLAYSLLVFVFRSFWTGQAPFFPCAEVRCSKIPSTQPFTCNQSSCAPIMSFIGCRIVFGFCCDRFGIHFWISFFESSLHLALFLLDRRIDR